MLNIDEYAHLPTIMVKGYSTNTSGTVERAVPEGRNPALVWEDESVVLPEGSILLCASTAYSSGAIIEFALHADGSMTWVETWRGGNNRYIHLYDDRPNPPNATLEQKRTLCLLQFKPEVAFVFYPGFVGTLGGSVQEWAKLGPAEAARLAEKDGPIFLA